jgi:hypothetical protein
MDEETINAVVAILDEQQVVEFLQGLRVMSRIGPMVYAAIKAKAPRLADAWKPEVPDVMQTAAPRPPRLVAVDRTPNLSMPHSLGPESA